MLFAAGLHGFLIAPASLLQRVLLVAGGFLLIKPGIVTDLIGAARSRPGLKHVPAVAVTTTTAEAARLKLAEVAVPPGGALLEKLAALAPGATDVLLRGVIGIARRTQRRRN